MSHRGSLLADLFKARDVCRILTTRRGASSAPSGEARLAESMAVCAGFEPTRALVQRVLRAAQQGRHLHEVLSGRSLGSVESKPRRPALYQVRLGTEWSFGVPRTFLTLAPLTPEDHQHIENDLGITGERRLQAELLPALPAFGTLDRFRRLQSAFDEYAVWVKEQGAFVVPVDPTSPEGIAVFDGIVRNEKTILRLAGVRADPSALAFLRFLILRGHFTSTDFLSGLWAGTADSFE
jgi:hypothetical protein